MSSSRKGHAERYLDAAELIMGSSIAFEEVYWVKKLLAAVDPKYLAVITFLQARCGMAWAQF